MAQLTRLVKEDIRIKINKILLFVFQNFSFSLQVGWLKSFFKKVWSHILDNVYGVQMSIIHTAVEGK